MLLRILSSILDQITALGDAPRLPADPLQRRLAGAALHARCRPTTWSRRDLGGRYATVFFALAFWRFLRKDVIS